MTMKFDTFFQLPDGDNDAKVGITIYDGRTILSFLAQGNSQIKDKVTKKVIGYKKRNPHRRQLVDQILPLLPDAEFVRYGSKSGGKTATNVSAPAMRKFYSKGGNFQFDLAIRGYLSPVFWGISLTGQPINADNRQEWDDLIHTTLGLSPIKGRPITIFTQS